MVCLGPLRSMATRHTVRSVSHAISPARRARSAGSSGAPRDRACCSRARSRTPVTSVTSGRQDTSTPWPCSSCPPSPPPSDPASLLLHPRERGLRRFAELLVAGEPRDQRDRLRLDVGRVLAEHLGGEDARE